MKTTKQPKEDSPSSEAGFGVERLVRLFSVGLEGFAEIIIWVPKFWFRNALMIDREVGPFVWFALLVTLPAVPFVALGCACAEAVVRMDGFCKSNASG